MNSNNYSSIWYFVQRYRLLLALIVILLVISSILESISILAFFPLFNSVLNQSGTDPTGILGLVQDVFVLIPIGSPLLAASIFLISTMLVKILFNLAKDGVIAYVNGKVLYSTKKEIWERYSSAKYLYMLDQKQGDLIFNVFEAPTGPSGVLTIISLMAMALLKVIAITIVLFAILPWAAVAVIIMGVLYYIVFHSISKKISFNIGAIMAQANSNQFVIANEFFSGFRQIITVNATDAWVKRFDVENRTQATGVSKEMAWNAVPRPIVELAVVATMLGIGLVIWFSGTNGMSDSLPKLGVFGVSLVQLMAPIASFGQSRMAVMSGLPKLQIAHEALISDIPQRTDGSITINGLGKGINFENVSFAYPGREDLFKGLNLNIKKGKVTAIVGSSGSGKTSLVNLLLGLIAPTGGSITVDGVPLEEIRKETWFKHIGFVSQDSFVHHASITDNILLGRSGSTVDEVIDAAKIADAHEFISEFSDSYDSIVGERGMRLSGGQQQRLSIARAMLNNPEILIFDEATSSLDTLSEKQVQDAIGLISENKTVVIIAHRLSTVEHADTIVVLEAGKVVEEGSHKELISRKGKYFSLSNVNL